MKTNPWLHKCHKFPEHRLLDHPSLVQTLFHNGWMVFKTRLQADSTCAISSKSMHFFTFSRSFFTILILTSASKRAAHTSYNLRTLQLLIESVWRVVTLRSALRTSSLMTGAALRLWSAAVIFRPRSAKTILGEFWSCVNAFQWAINSNKKKVFFLQFQDKIQKLLWLEWDVASPLQPFYEIVGFGAFSCQDLWSEL